MLKYWDFKDYVSYPYPTLEGYKVCAQSHSYTTKIMGMNTFYLFCYFEKSSDNNQTKS